VALLGFAMALAACGTSSDDGAAASSPDAGADAPAPHCSVTAPTECPDPAPAWADVEPLFDGRCTSCHSGADGQPWPLTDYDHVASWGPEIRGQLLDCSMPPLDAGVPLVDDERLAILTWIRCGMPR
jgi:hypothetical protein